MSGDAYQRGKSGYSKKDEKAAKEYGERDHKLTGGVNMPKSEREYRRDIGAPQSYLRNTKTAEGREINKKNVNTQDSDRNSQGRPPMSRKWVE